MTATEYLKEIDGIIAKSMDGSEFKPCCSKGCSTCCSEPLMVDAFEARHMLDGLTPEQTQRVTERTREWVKKAEPFFKAETRDGYINSYSYLEQDIKCPFLENKLCMVYDRRPMGCRTYFAMGDPEHCKMPHRKEQLISNFNFEAPQWTNLWWKVIQTNGSVDMDHLGVQLARLLLGEEHETSVRKRIEFT